MTVSFNINVMYDAIKFNLVMKVGRTIALTCGHHTLKEEIDVDETRPVFEINYLNFVSVVLKGMGRQAAQEYYCETCSNSFPPKGFRIFISDVDDIAPKEIV
jgi:hypothetical protein